MSHSFDSKWYFICSTLLTRQSASVYTVGIPYGLQRILKEDWLKPLLL